MSFLYSSQCMFVFQPPGESDIDQLFHIMRTFGTLTPRMLQLVQTNPLFVGVTVRAGGLMCGVA